MQQALIPQIRRHVEKLWRAIHDLRTQSNTLGVCLADHTARLDIIEGAIMDRSARHDREAVELARQQADFAARLQVGGRVISGDIESPDL